jgi:hypothetical protein
MSPAPNDRGLFPPSQRSFEATIVQEMIASPASTIATPLLAYSLCFPLDVVPVSEFYTAQISFEFESIAKSFMVEFAFPEAVSPVTYASPVEANTLSFPLREIDGTNLNGWSDHAFSAPISAHLVVPSSRLLKATLVISALWKDAPKTLSTCLHDADGDHTNLPVIPVDPITPPSDPISPPLYPDEPVSPPLAPLDPVSPPLVPVHPIDGPHSGEHGNDGHMKDHGKGHCHGKGDGKHHGKGHDHNMDHGKDHIKAHGKGHGEGEGESQNHKNTHDHGKEHSDTHHGKGHKEDPNHPSLGSVDKERPYAKGHDSISVGKAKSRTFRVHTVILISSAASLCLLLTLLACCCFRSRVRRHRQSVTPDGHQLLIPEDEEELVDMVQQQSLAEYVADQQRREQAAPAPSAPSLLEEYMKIPPFVPNPDAKY